MRTYDSRENEQDTIIQEKAIQRKEKHPQSALQTIVDNSDRVKQLQHYQDMANRGMDNRALFQLKSNSESGLNFPIQRKENKTGLPDNLKSGIENLSGYAMDDVKVHYNSDKPAQLEAHAYAQGTDIHLGAGQEKHLPHETWHVVQQKQGRVKPTTEIGGAAVNDNGSLEKEADVMGAKALETASAGPQNTAQLKAIDNNVVQRKGEKFKGTYDENDKTKDRFNFERDGDSLGQGFSEGIWIGDKYSVGGRAWWKLWLGKKEKLEAGKPVYFDEDNYQEGKEKTEVYVKGSQDSAPAKDIGLYRYDDLFQEEAIITGDTKYSEFPGAPIRTSAGKFSEGDRIRFVSKQSIVPLRNASNEEYTQVHSADEKKGAWVNTSDLNCEVMEYTGENTPVGALPDIPSDTFMEFVAHKLAYGGKSAALAASEVLEENGYAADASIAFTGPSGFQVIGLFPYKGSNVKPVMGIRGTASARGAKADIHILGVGKGQFDENRDLIESILNMAESSNNKFVVTGHSLGGAMAQRTAIQFPSNIARLVTFQSPKVAGNNDKSKNAVDVINNGGEEENIKHYIATGDIVDDFGFLSSHLGGNVEEINTGRWTPLAHTDFVHGDMDYEEAIIEAFGSIEEYERVTGKKVRD